MWTRHWNLSGDPFLGSGTTYVPSPDHEEAVARLLDAIETGQRLAVLRAEDGLGRTVVLNRAIAQARGPHRRIARVNRPVDGPSLLAALAVGLGSAPSMTLSTRRAHAWKALADAVRLCHWQKLHAVLVIDDAHELDDPADRRDLDRLTHLAPASTGKLTVLQTYREPRDVETTFGSAGDSWLLAVRISPLTRSESVRYVLHKLASAGRDEPAFTPRALERLHALSEGVPRGLDRLASLALMAGALRGLEIVPPDLVDGIAYECIVPSHGNAA